MLRELMPVIGPVAGEVVKGLLAGPDDLAPRNPPTQDVLAMRQIKRRDFWEPPVSDPKQKVIALGIGVAIGIVLASSLRRGRK